MSLRAKGAQLAEAPVVVLTRWEARLLAHMLVETVVAVGAVSGSREGLTLWHASKVVLVQVLALHALLA